MNERNKVEPLPAAWPPSHPLLLAVTQGPCLTSTVTASASVASHPKKEGRQLELS